MQSLVFFNNKGGVGKTTLCCNISSYIASKFRKKVLLVDCDPQCNSTQLILGDSRCEDLYFDADGGFAADTIHDVLRPIIDGDSGIDSAVTPVDAKDNRFDVDLLPGHPKLAMLEDALSGAWAKATAGEIEGLRRSHWATSLLVTLDKYDLVVFDVGPSLGALNRSVLLGANCFITPMGCDIFSIVGIRNISEWLNSWLRSYKQGYDLALSTRKDAIDRYGIPDDLSISRGYIGYTVQQYITKSKEGVRRPTKAYETIINQMPAEIADAMLPFSNLIDDPGKANMGDVPHLFSLIPLAQAANAPVHELKSVDGLVGAQYSQAENYERIIRRLAQRVCSNLGMELKR